ncbi:MAG: hypothetical protein R6X11_12205, partial [Desulfonatronovibrio sp.]
LYFSQDAGGYAGFPRFYTSLLENYWNEFKIRRPGFKPGPDDYKMQQKFCLLGWTLKKLVKERPSAMQQKNLNRFLDNVILGPEHCFAEWLAQCPE